MRVAVINDIHANLPALDAVLEDIRRAPVDRIVVGGDVLPGPMPAETLTCLQDLVIPVQYLYGNGDLGVLAQMTATDPSTVTYWGAASGAPLPEPIQDLVRWTARQLRPEHERLLASWPKTLSLGIDGKARCSSATRHRETKPRSSSHARSAPLTGICRSHRIGGRVRSHSHAVRSNGRKYSCRECWQRGDAVRKTGRLLLLGPDVQLRHTPDDLASAAARIRETAYPQAEEAARSILEPPSEEATLAAFAPFELT
jgi:hypothetical protein